MRDTTTVGQVLHNASASVHHASDTIMDIPVRIVVLYGIYGIMALCLIWFIYMIPTIIRLEKENHARCVARKEAAANTKALEISRIAAIKERWSAY